MVPYSTIHKVSNKHHKTDKRGTYFEVHMSSSISENFEIKQPTAPTTFSKMQWTYLKKPMLTEK